MPDLKYYYDFVSQPSRAVYIFLKLNNIPFDACPIALRKGVHHTDEFKEKFNRFQKVPFLHHGDFKLAESVALIRYIAREYRDKILDHWYPRNSQEQAKVDEYLEWQHIGLRYPCSYYFWFKYLLPALTGSPSDPDELSKLENNVITSLDEFEELWLSQGHKYIAGDQISVADIFAACELEQPRMAGFDLSEGRPKLKSYLQMVRKECSPAYEEAHAFLNQIAKKTMTSKL